MPAAGEHAGRGKDCWERAPTTLGALLMRWFEHELILDPDTEYGTLMNPRRHHLENRSEFVLHAEQITLGRNQPAVFQSQDSVGNTHHQWIVGRDKKRSRSIRSQVPK